MEIVYPVEDDNTFLWKLHDLHNNESNVFDGISLTPPGLDSTLSVKRQQYAMHCDPIREEINLILQLSEPFKIFEFDFWKWPESYGETELCVKATNDGRVHAVVSWWVLQLDQEGPYIIPLLLGPDAWCDHWKQCEDFEKIFSQAKYEAASCGGGSECSPLDRGVEEKIRIQSWFFAVDGKNKGRVYGVGKVEAGYRCGDNFTQPTTSSASSQKITMLEEKVRKTQEENERLSQKFETLLNVVLSLLPVDAAQQIFQQSEENQQDPQQSSPQPSYQATENQENNDHFPSNYEDY
ncbi:hypothetical protein Fmac_023858 [Flemingia macrophylla]|uniref:Protein arginine N-methyltransferase domain-containing protein n=1 Tax=Flemingia macrophylla TaxID=520843 RepID=A0ABD1LPE0_9FABA